MALGFGAGSISSFSIDTVFNGNNYTAGVVSPVANNNAISNGLSLSGAGLCSSCTGQASPNFYGTQAQGAGTVYTIQNSVGNAVNGAAVMDIFYSNNL